MTKRIEFSQHSLIKIEILASHDITVSTDVIITTLRNPEKVESRGDGKFIAQKRLNGLVLRVVYQEYTTMIVVITIYPGRRSRYENNEV